MGCQYLMISYQDLIKMSILLKMIYIFNKIPIRIGDNFYLIEIDDLILKCIWKGKGPKVARTILKKNEVAGLTVSGFKTSSN